MASPSAASTMFLSAISHAHGEPKPIRELDEAGSTDPQLADDLLEAYRESTGSALDMACEVGGQTLATAGVRPDCVLYATETDDGVSPLEARVRVATALDCSSAVVSVIAGHACGNLGLLLRAAEEMLSRSPVILLITSDKAAGPRMMPDALSVLSDGAAAVLATRTAPTAGSPNFLVHGMSVSSDATGRIDAVGIRAQRRAVGLGRSAVAALRSITDREPKDFTRVLFNNYRLSSQRFLSGAAGFAVDQLLPGPVPRYAHAFAADLLVNCDLLSRTGDIGPGDRIALSATGPQSWALIDVEVWG